MCVSPPLCRFPPCVCLCVCSLASLFLLLHAHVSFCHHWLNHLWSEARTKVSGDPPTLICVCVCVCLRRFMHRSPFFCCSLAPLLMTQQSNTFSLLFREPQIISWSIKQGKYCNPRLKTNKKKTKEKLKSSRTQQSTRCNKPIRFSPFRCRVQKAPIAQIHPGSSVGREDVERGGANARRECEE